MGQLNKLNDRGGLFPFNSQLCALSDARGEILVQLDIRAILTGWPTADTNQLIPDGARDERRYLPVVDDLTAFLEIFDCAMNVPWFPTKPRLVDGCRVRNRPQLVLLDINSVLVEGTFGPPHDVSHLARAD